MPNIYEVARRANVSIATVSRVQRGGVGVSSETRARVLRTIEELGYRPSRLGRSLAEGRHSALGIVFPDLSGPYYSGVILGFEEHAAAAGRSVLILGTHGRRDVALQVLDLAERVDGLVIMGRTVPDEFVEQLGRDGVAVVLLARPEAGSADTVRAENSASAAVLAEHLFEHGCRRLVFVGDPDGSPDAAERWQGFHDAHRRAGLPEPEPPFRSAMRERDGYAAALEVLRRRDRPEALFCANDEIALGAYGAAQTLGLSVPGDIAVTGWDDIPVARFAAPPLTTVRQPLQRLGATAAADLDERIRGDRESPRHVVLPTELVVRASCGCAPALAGGSI